jgi:hypothetical protein
MRIFAVVVLVLAAFVSDVYAGITEQGIGMLFGSDHAFYITAPKGWVLDNQSGVSQGLPMVFYPIGQTWKDSPVIVYGRSIPKDSQIKSIPDQVNETVEDFRTHGNPNYKAELKSSLALPNGLQVALYHFEGDQWCNYEAVGYIEEDKTINYLVFNARTKQAFDKYITSFPEFLSSYKNASTASPETNKDQSFSELVERAKLQSSTSEGRLYEKKVIEALGTSMANIMRRCTGYIDPRELEEFEVVCRIASDGKITDAYAKSETSLSSCFKGLILNVRCPPHKFGSFLQHIDMKIKQ